MPRIWSDIQAMEVEEELNATPPVWTGKSPAYVCRDLVMRNLAHYVTIETALSTGAQLREQKRAADGTAAGIRKMKNAKWGRIATKYNCPRIQEYVAAIEQKAS
jgi:hypothetical protein